MHVQNIIMGQVLCCWILKMISAMQANWRTLIGVSGQTSDTVVTQGIWDICLSSTTSRLLKCNLKSTDTTYFSNQIIPIAQGMTVVSLIVSFIGMAAFTTGILCWRARPYVPLVSFSGVLIFCSGVLIITPIAWYTHLLPSLNTTSTFTNPKSPEIKVGYCIVLGFIGGILEVLAGVMIFVSIFFEEKLQKHDGQLPGNIQSQEPSQRNREPDLKLDNI